MTYAIFKCPLFIFSKKWNTGSFFFVSGFLSQTLTIHRTAGKGRGRYSLPFGIHSTASTCSQTLRSLFTTLHVEWLSRIFSRNVWAYQTATRWDWPHYQITILIDWLIDDAMFVYLLDKLMLSFCYSDLTCETGGFELALTMTLVLQASRLTKCASHC